MAADLPFPKSLPEFQRIFPTDAACASYLEKLRWPEGFACECGEKREPYRFDGRPGVLRCRACMRDVSLTAGTVMERTHYARGDIESAMMRGVRAGNQNAMILAKMSGVDVDALKA